MESKKTYPKVFIASSSESREIVRELQDQLYNDAKVMPWWDIFDLSATTIESLLVTLRDVEFGIFVFSADDKLRLRNHESLSVRDNVIFEFGLFIGGLGRERCFFIIPSNNKELHLPTDLLGVTPAIYDDTESDLQHALAHACHVIRKAMRKHHTLNSSNIQSAQDNLPLETNMLKREEASTSIDAPPYLKKLIQEMNDPGNLVDQRSALKKLAQSRHHMVREILAEALTHPAPDIRLDAAHQLAKFKDIRAVPFLLEAFNEADESTINDIATSLKKIGKSIIPELIEALSDKTIQEGVITTLSMMGRGALPALVNALLNEDSDICSGACRVLGSIEDSDAVPHLLAVIQVSDINICLEAIDALGSIRDTAAVPDLLSSLQTKNLSVRSKIVKTLGKIGNAKSVPDLLKILFEDRSVRLEVIEALGNIGDPSAVPDLCKILESENKYVCAAICEALGKIGDANAVPYLLKALHTQDSYKRSAVTLALGNIGDAAIPDILEATQVESSSIHLDIIQALKTIGTSKAEVALKSLQ